MTLTLDSTAELHNGVGMPILGLGVYRTKEGEEVESAVLNALKAGYRMIDTASIYQNEEGVGRAVRASGIPREQVFITSKVFDTEQGYESTFKAFEASLSRLGMDYLDLYLVHFPVEDRYKDTWRALEELYEQGRVRAIGVSNFEIRHLEDLMAACRVKPMVNQVELHPLWQRNELREYCRKEGIQVESWRPIMEGRFDFPVLQELSSKYGKTPAQIVIRWHLQHGLVTIPKSVREERIRENADVFDFELTPEDMKRIDGMNENRSLAKRPKVNW